MEQVAAGGLGGDNKEFKMLKPKVVKRILEKGMGPGIQNIVYLTIYRHNSVIIVSSVTSREALSRNRGRTTKSTHKLQCSQTYAMSI